MQLHVRVFSHLYLFHPNVCLNHAAAVYVRNVGPSGVLINIYAEKTLKPSPLGPSCTCYDHPSGIDSLHPITYSTYNYLTPV